MPTIRSEFPEPKDFKGGKYSKEVSVKLTKLLQGDVYESLIALGIQEGEISNFVRVNGSAEEGAKIDHIQTMAPLCTQFIKLFRQNTPKEWAILSGFPIYREMIKARGVVRSWWRGRPR